MCVCSRTTYKGNYRVVYYEYKKDTRVPPFQMRTRRYSRRFCVKGRCKVRCLEILKKKGGRLARGGESRIVNFSVELTQKYPKLYGEVAQNGGIKMRKLVYSNQKGGEISNKNARFRSISTR